MIFSDGYGEFPSFEMAHEDGLLAIGATLATDRLIHAYKNGIFPWYNEGEEIMWYCPQMRCVLSKESFHVSKSFKKFLNKTSFKLTHNQCFEDVIKSCASIPRKGQEFGTWIHDDMIYAYTALHEVGWAHSFEVWEGNNLVGGTYGVMVGDVFCGESMFSKVPNASKYALYTILQRDDVSLIDAQIESEHLMQLGAFMISAEEFLEFLKKI